MLVNGAFCPSLPVASLCMFSANLSILPNWFPSIQTELPFPSLLTTSLVKSVFFPFSNWCLTPSLSTMFSCPLPIPCRISPGVFRILPNILPAPWNNSPGTFSTLPANLPTPLTSSPGA